MKFAGVRWQMKVTVRLSTGNCRNNGIFFPSVSGNALESCQIDIKNTLIVMTWHH